MIIVILIMKSNINNENINNDNEIILILMKINNIINENE